jgi:hypothetical protein
MPARERLEPEPGEVKRDPEHGRSL